MPTYTRAADRITTLTRSGSEWNEDNDGPMTVGKGDNGTVRRLRARFPEPSWPSRGSLKRATLTVDEASGSSYSGWRGSSPRVSVKRMADAGSTGTGSPAEFNISGRTSKDVTSQVRQMLPTRLGGNNERWGLFLVQSVDESNANRSTVLTRRMTLEIVIDTRVVPSEVEVLEVIGAQEGTTEPVIAATDDGRTLEVRFGFAAGPGEWCSKAELELRTVGSQDPTETTLVTGTVIKTSGNVAPLPGGGTNIYRQRITGIPQETEGRYRIRATSNTGKQGPWTSLEDGWVRLVTIPGPPVDIVVSPFVESPTITASMPSSHPGTISRMEALVSLLPSGEVRSVESDIGGSLRRATLTLSDTLADGQRTSTRVRITDEDGIVGRWSGPVEQTHHTAPDVTVSPSPGRLLTRTPTITLGFPLADGARLRLLHETDDNIEIYSSGTVALTDQTSHGFAIPAGTLTYGQKFRVAGAYVPDGGGSTLNPESEPVGPYSIAALPTAQLTIVEAVGSKVPTRTPTFLRTVTDPDGGATHTTILLIREAATPAGTGAFVTKYVSSPGTGEIVLPETLEWEQDYDALLWARNDITALLGTTLNGATSVGATSVTLASTSGLVVGSRFIIYSATTGRSEERAVLTLPGANVVTFTDALEWAHLSGETVSAYPLPPLPAWVTFSVLEPPDVDLLTPADAATVTSAWQEFDWTTTANGGRTVAGSTLNLYDVDEALIREVDIVGTGSIANAPAFLLEDATDYAWDVTAVDSEGMATTSARRTFTTAFTEPDALASVTVIQGEAGMVVSWDSPVDPDIHHVEVSWQADDGTWVRIDGGPEELGDEREAFTGSSLTHIGARLGVNAYSVRPHNGWRAAEPTNATATLTWTDLPRGAWELVGEDGAVTPVSVSDAPITTTAMIVASQPPGGYNQAVHLGVAARSIPMRVQYLPAEDGPLATTLRLMMADPIADRDASPQWIRPAGGYLVDPVWCILSSMTASPAQAAAIDLSLDWLEVGPPVHAILPPAVETPPEDEGDLIVDIAALDFGDITVA